MSCPDCFQGAVHDGTPTGTTTKLHGLDTYVAEPANGGQPPRGIVVIVPDAFGWAFVNLRLLADSYATKKDYRVYLPDFMDGNSMPQWVLGSMKSAMTKGTWLDTLAKPYHFAWIIYAFATWAIPNRFGKSFPVVKGFMEALRRDETAADLPVGVAGFCWGGKHAIALAGDDSRTKTDDGSRPLVDVGFAGHPSFVTLYDDIEKIRVPFSIAVGDSDNQVSVEQAGRIREIIEAKPEGQRGEVRVYRGYGHGFACRADITNGDPEGAVEAEDQALAWFEKHFGTG